jgi:predicted porin
MRHSRAMTALLASGFISSGCLAQTSVALYGVVDASVREGSGLNANNAAAPSGHTTAVTSGVNNTSVWGVKGQEDLGGGWKAVLRLESGINVDTGSQAKTDRLFDRHAWVGLDSPYGLLALGRQPSLISDALATVDPLGKRYASFNPNINVAGLSNTAFGTHKFGVQYGPSGYADNFYRLDNTVKYTGTFGPWQARAAYSAGEVAGDSSASSSHGVALAYQHPGFAVSGAVMQFRSLQDLPLDAWSVGAALKLDGWQFKANVARNEATTQHNDVGPDKTVHQRVLSAGVSHKVGYGLLLTTALYDVRREATGYLDDGFDRGFVYLEKSLAPRTTAYVEADYTVWRGDAAGLTASHTNDRHGTGLTLGLMQKF